MTAADSAQKEILHEKNCNFHEFILYGYLFIRLRTNQHSFLYRDSSPVQSSGYRPVASPLYP
jgi:hypothetical protein